MLCVYLNTLRASDPVVAKADSCWEIRTRGVKWNPILSLREDPGAK